MSEVSTCADFTEKELLEKISHNRDHRAFECIYDTYAALVFSRCLRLLNSKVDAEGAAQDIWLAAYLKVGTFKHQASFKTWLFRVVNNECFNRLRKGDRFASLDEYLENGTEVDSEENVYDTKVIKSQVTEVLAQVSKEVRALLMLKYVDEYTYDEIARLTGKSPSAIKMCISRAKELIRKRSH